MNAKVVRRTLFNWLVANHPLNLALRFFLELTLLAALGYWGWTQHTGAVRFLFAFAAPSVAAALWAIFRVPGDGGAPVVVTPGPLRLLLEAVLFVAAALALRAANQPRLTLAFAVVSVLHYAASYDRVIALLRD